MDENNKKPQFDSAKTGYKSTVESTRYAGPLVKDYRLGDSYILIKHLGSGGMGEVWLANQMHVDSSGSETVSRQVVVKVVPPHVQDAEDEMDRVRSTFKTIHGLHHEHICPTYGLEQDDVYGFFLVMKYVNGPKLIDHCNTFPRRIIPLPEVLEIIRPIANALDYAHRKKVVHRDIKPQNIMIDKNDGVQIIDFGLADQIRTSLSHVSQVRMGNSGTPHYMAPEQWDGLYQDAKTDQFSLAVMTYYFLTGRYPFPATNAEILRIQVHENVLPPIEGYPKSLHAVLARGMAKQRESRYATCGDFYLAMKALIKSPPLDKTPKQQRRKYKLATLILLFFTVFFTIFFLNFFVPSPHPVDSVVTPIKEPAIINAVQEGNLPEIQRLLIENPNLLNSQRNHKGETLLHLATAKGDFEIAEYLFHFMEENDYYKDNVKAYVNTTDNAGRTPLHDAAEHGFNDIVAILIEKGANVGIKTANGETPLFLVAKKDSEEIVEMLLNAGANPYESVPGGKTLYEVAKPEIKKLLRDKMTQGKSLFEAVAEGNPELVQLWIGLEPRCVHDRDVNDQTPLHLAIRSGYFEIAELLLEHAAEVNTVAAGETPLYLASVKNPVESSVTFVALLLEHNADPWAKTPDGKILLDMDGSDAVKQLIRDAMTPTISIFEASQNGDTVIVQKWLSLEPESVNDMNKDGNFPLLVAIQYNQREIAALLIKHNADVNIIDKAGQTPLYLAVLNDSAELVEMFLDAGADVRVTIPGKISLLKIAKSTEVKDLLREALTPKISIVEAIESNNISIVQQWLEVNPEIVNTKNDKDQLPLHVAVIGNKSDIVNLLTSNSTDINLKNSADETPLYLAVLNGSVELVQVLLDAGADPFIKTPEGKNLYEIANPEINIRLGKRMAQLKTIFKAVEEGDLDSARQLILSDPKNVTQKDDEGQTPLFVAVRFGQREIAALLIKHDADVNAIDKTGQTPISFAALNNSMELVTLLLEHKADTRIKTPEGKTLLEIAQSDEMKRLLLDAMTKNMTIFEAIQNDNQALVQQWVLIKSEILKEKNSLGQLPLHVAVTGNNSAIVTLLIKNGADANSQDGDRMTPLHLAVQNKSEKVVETLLKAKAEVNVKNQFGNTPLHLAMTGDDMLGIVKQLIENGADINMMNATGEMPLLTAVSNDCVESVQWLLIETNSERFAKTPEGNNLLLEKATSERMTQIIRDALTPKIPLLEAIHKDDQETIRKWGDFQLPETARVLLIQAKIHDEAGRFGEAEKYYLLAIEVARHHYTDPYRHFAVFLKSTCRSDSEVETKLQKVYDAHPENTVLLLNLIECYIANNNETFLDQAMKNYENTSEKDISGNRLVYTFFQYLTQRDERDRHAESLNQLLKTKTTKDSWDLGQLLNQLDIQNDPDRESIKDFVKQVSN